MKKFNEYGYETAEVSNGYKILIGKMEDEQYNNFESRWGYKPSRYTISIDNGCGLALGNETIKTQNEIIKRINSISFLTIEEREFLLSLVK